MNRNIFKYNMSFYYQSTLVYLIVFILYVVIRGEFVEGAYTLVVHDPIIYFFALIIIISILSLLYNLFKNRYLEITDKAIMFVSRFKTRQINIDDIKSIRLFSEKDTEQKKSYRLITISLKNRKRPFILRPYDYEKQSELAGLLKEIKSEKNL